MSAADLLSRTDPELWDAISQEIRRQEDHVELIASENYVSPAVLAAQGSVLTNKYAEGYPGRRYYGGCEYVDLAETLAIERAKQLFGADWANVQPHSGSQANQSVYFAVLQPGDTVLGMSLAHGGHLTHGSPVNLSGKLYKFVSYGLNEREEIDYDAAERLAREHRPKLIVTGASAYSLRIDWRRFRVIADQVGALLMADMAHYAGMVAVGLYPSPIGVAHYVTSTTHKTLRGPRGGLVLGGGDASAADRGKAINSTIFPGLQGGPLMHVIAAKAAAFGEALRPEFKAYQQQVLDNAQAMARVLMARGVRIVSGRTESHMMLLDLRGKRITGKDAEAALGRAHITVNKNAIPNDPEKPMVTSGVRIGTPAMTTRGFKVPEAERLAHLIADVLDRPADAASLGRVAAEVKALCARHPVYA
ncbi:MAG TPA: serine hydroxymethyltransferase [Burkholderiales bacterium]|jgi:glycine hydroxymethyltransferase|nr:serine hydroxymethyltransferase [Burkholderiales bacterium]